jgi:hypothetical protein
MSDLFQMQGFGVLSNWNGQVGDAASGLAMQQIAATGANSIEIVPRIWTQSRTSSAVFADPNKTESDASLIRGILNAEKAGLAVVLKPDITGLDHTMSSSLAPGDIAAFFATYKAEIVHLAQIAQETGVATFVIGNELGGLTTAPYLSYWTDIIQAVRAVYHGEVTYAAATDEAYKVSFWNQLDAIGVNTYPPLAVSGSTPTVQDIVAAWHQAPPASAWWAPTFDGESPYDFISSLASRYGKPVLMTEAGYLSLDYNGQISGDWQLTGALDTEEQAAAYQAFMQVWGPSAGTWLQGVEFWDWDLNGAYSPAGYSPMGKPAQAIVTEYFKGAGALAADVAALTPADIAGIAALGIRAIAAADHDVTLSAAQQAALGANGISLVEPYGTGSQTWTWNADGSLHDIEYYAINGVTATTVDVLYAPTGATGSGIMSGDGTGSAPSLPVLHEVTVTGITGEAWTSSDTLYGANGKSLSATWSNGASVVQAEAWNPDGSIRDIHYYGITGQAYTDYDVVYDASGHKAASIFSNGLMQTWSYNADGSLHESVVSGITGSIAATTDTIYGANGKAASETWRNGTTPVQSETWNADGSIHDIHYYGNGQPSTDYDLLYANGRKAEAIYADGMTQSWTYNADGSTHESFLGGLTGASYTASATGFGAGGRSVVHQYANTDGSETIQGLTDHLVFTDTAAGTSVATAAGASFAFAPNGNTVLTGGGASETFVLAAGFGHATITDFVPQSQADTNHDQIVFAPGTFADVDDVLAHAVAAGANTLITDHAGDTLVLSRVAPAQLAARDFSVG